MTGLPQGAYVTTQFQNNEAEVAYDPDSTPPGLCVFLSGLDPEPESNFVKKRIPGVTFQFRQQQESAW